VICCGGENWWGWAGEPWLVTKGGVGMADN